ncbi:MAG TPA: hypothetical protein VGJ32_06330 [Solirubrobacteraceae bacterium]
MHPRAALLAVGLAACGSGGSTAPDAPIVTVDAARPDGEVSPDGELPPDAAAPDGTSTPDAASSDATPGGSVAVSLATGGIPLTQVTLVSQTSDGAVYRSASPVGGAASLEIPTGGMVTVAFLVNGADHYLWTVLGTQEGDQIVVGPVGRPAAGPNIGQVTVTAPAAFPGAIGHTIAGATCPSLVRQALVPASPISFPVDAACIAASSPSLDLIAAAVDASGSTLAYSLGGAAFAGTDAAVTLPAWTAARTLDVTAQNVPAAATSVRAQIELGSGTAPYAAEFQDWFAGGDPISPFHLHLPGGSFQSAVSYVVTASTQLPDGSQSGRTISGTVASPYAPLAVDLAALLPALGDVTMTTTEPARPVVAWTAESPLPGGASGLVALSWQDAQQRIHYWFIVVPVSSSVRAPALPAGLSAWLPTADRTFVVAVAFDTRAPADGRFDLVVDAPAVPASAGKTSRFLTCVPSCH